eukprot:Sspe_Gene.92615::Locus_65197_Transcript_1_1_Confidence_1.000_Length_801::g.92615::m.92615
MSVDKNDQWMVAIGTWELLNRIGEDEVRVASFYGHMQGRRMPRDVFERLCEALQSNTTLEVIDLDHCEVARWDDGIEMLLASIRDIRTLERLNLNSCQMTDHHVKSLCAFLKHNTSVRKLWLYGNSITLAGAISLHR